MGDEEKKGRKNSAERASISNGPNARPRNETISQTGEGLPDDSSQPVEIDPEKEKQIADKIRSL